MHDIRFVCASPHPTVVSELGMFTALEEIDFSQCRDSQKYLA